MHTKALAMAIGLLLLLPAAASAGTVAGAVTDEAGAGVAGVHVELFQRAGGGSAGTAWTDADGRYEIDVSTGSYDLLFESHGELLSEWHGDTQDRAQAEPVEVSELEPVTADAVLAPGGAISGTVTNAHGAPVEGVLVRAANADGSTVWGAGAPFTDQNGEYRIRRLPTGAYKVHFDDGAQALDEWYDGVPDENDAQLVPVTAGTTSAGIDATLGLYGAIAGTVTTADGSSAGGGTVRLYVGEAPIASVSVGVGGAYAIANVAPGRYRLRFEPPGGTVPLGEALVPQFYGGAWFAEDAADVTVLDDETTTADWTLPREAVLGGALRFPDGSGARALATVYDLQGRVVGQAGFAGNGRWQARGLPAGQFRVAFSSSELLPFDHGGLTPPAPFYVETEYYRDRFSLGTANPIAAAAGSVDLGLDTTLTRAGTITGRLTNSTGGPLKNIKVFLVRDDGRRAGPFRSDAAGRYTAYGLRTGLWTVLFIPESSGLLSEYYADSPNRAGAQPIDVKFGRTVEASATIARAARISGLVTDEARGAIPGVKVTVYDGFGANVATTTTSASGSYTVGRLPTGSYRVGFAPPEDSGFAGEFYDDAAQFADAAAIFLIAGQSAPAVDAELAPF